MGLIHLCDIDQVISRFSKELDWVSVVERAKAWGFERCLYLTLKMVSELLGTKTPEETIETCRTGGFNAGIRELARAQLFGDKENIAIADTFPELLEMEGFLNKMLFLLTRVFPTRKEMVRFYPIKAYSLKLYLYYLVRIRDIVKKYGKGVVGTVRRNEVAIKSLSRRQQKDHLKEWMRKGIG